jgi:hypothetical protein
MNAVYEIGLPNNDFDGGMVDPIGHLVIPSFDCPSCGCIGGRPPVWYASLQPATPEATALCQQGLPEKVATPMEYEIAREKVRQAFQTRVRLLPGSIVGMRPIEVRSQSTIGGLSTKKLKQNLGVCSRMCG